MPAKMIPYTLPRVDVDAMRDAGDTLLAQMTTRRSCRSFSAEPVPRDVIERVIAIAHTAPSGANRKPFLEVAPWLVVLFRIDWEEVDGKRLHNYYPTESIGIAAGMFLMACHRLGLATLTHTPSPMRFLRQILGRPASEKPFLLIPVGYPSANCTVPDIPKKPLSEALQFNRA